MIAFQREGEPSWGISVMNRAGKDNLFEYITPAIEIQVVEVGTPLVIINFGTGRYTSSPHLLDLWPNLNSRMRARIRTIFKLHFTSALSLV